MPRKQSVAGCPIRKSARHRPFAPRRGLSQLITSFFASMSQGIHPAPFYSSSRFFFRILQLSAHPTRHRGNKSHTCQMNAAGYLCLSTVYRVSQCQRSLIYNKDRKEEGPRKAGRKEKSPETPPAASFDSRTASPERRCSSRTFRYGYLVTT